MSLPDDSALNYGCEAESSFTGKRVLHSGYLEQPQKRLPAYLPDAAFRKTIGDAHFGQVRGASSRVNLPADACTELGSLGAA